MVYHRIIVHNLRGSLYYAARTGGGGFIFTQMSLFAINLSKEESDKIKEHLAKNYVMFEENLVLDTSMGENIWF